MRHLLRTCRICIIWRESYDRCLDVSSGYCSNQNRLLYLLSFPFRFEKDENKCIHSLGRVLFVYETHYLVSFLAGLYWSVVITAFAEPQQFQLIIKTEFGLGGYQSSAGIGIPNAFDARFTKPCANECRAELVRAMPSAAKVG